MLIRGDLGPDLQRADSNASTGGSRPDANAQGLGPDDRDGLEDRWKPSIQLDQEEAIVVRELDATAHPPPQHDQLMRSAAHLPQVGSST